MVRRVSSSEELPRHRPRRLVSSSPAVTTRVPEKASSSHKRKRGAGTRTASKRDHAPHEDRKEAEEDAAEGSSSGGESEEEEEQEDEVEDGNDSKQTLGDGYYQVEAVRKKRVRKGELQYLIKWCGWPESANTWEPFENVKECADIIEEFENSRLAKSSKKGRGKCKAGASRTVERKKRGASDSMEEGSAADIGDDSPSPDLPEESVESPLSAGGPDGTKSKVGDNHAAVKDNVEQGNMPAYKNICQELQANDVAKDVCTLPPLEGGEVRSVVAVNKADDKDEAASAHPDVDLRPETSPAAEDTQNKVSGDKLNILPVTEDLDNGAGMDKCTGAKKRKQGFVRRVCQSSEILEDDSKAVADEDRPDESLEKGNGAKDVKLDDGQMCNALSVSKIHLLAPPVSPQGSHPSPCTVPITKIIKAINYSKTCIDGKRDVTVLFKAFSADGREVCVDNKFMRANDPLLLIDFYEKHLRYSSPGTANGEQAVM